MNKPIVLGIDPGAVNCGIAALGLDQSFQGWGWGKSDMTHDYLQRRDAFELPVREVVAGRQTVLLAIEDMQFMGAKTTNQRAFENMKAQYAFIGYLLGRPEIYGGGPWTTVMMINPSDWRLRICGKRTCKPARIREAVRERQIIPSNIEWPMVKYGLDHRLDALCIADYALGVGRQRPELRKALMLN